ncbi:Putative Pol polyprotein, partial [Calypte anna]
FAFTVPSVNKAEQAQRYHWVVLLQGMKNSPTCQIYVAWALQPLRSQFPELIIYHYMDDILIAGRTLNHDDVLAHVTQIVEQRGLKIAPEKVQKHEPWKYLGWTITGSAVRPQKVAEITTLSDVQKLVGDIQWVRSLCGITNDDLQPLIDLLGTTSIVTDKRELQPIHQKALTVIQETI